MSCFMGGNFNNKGKKMNIKKEPKQKDIHYWIVISAGIFTLIMGVYAVIALIFYT